MLSSEFDRLRRATREDLVMWSTLVEDISLDGPGSSGVDAVALAIVKQSCVVNVNDEGSC